MSNFIKAKQVVSSFKNCVLGKDGYTLSSKNSVLYIDVSKHKKPLSLIFKRISGSGDVYINGTLRKLSSKVIEVVDIDSVEGIQVSRKNSIGQVLFIGIIAGSTASEYYNGLLSKISCDKISVKKNRLIAEKNAKIKSFNVKNILTTPINCAIKLSDYYSFVNSCAIVDIELGHETTLYELIPSNDDPKKYNMNELSVNTKIKSDDYGHDIKRFSDLILNEKVINENISINLNPISISGKSWAEKASLVSDVTVQSDGVLLAGLGELVDCDKLWLDEFSSFSPIENDIRVLSNCKIFSSSLPNVQFLKKHFERVEYLPKVWPWIEPKECLDKTGFALLFNRGNNNYKEVLKLGIEDLVVVNARGSNDNVMASFGPYMNYNEMLWLILNARCVIDLPDCNHYSSGLLEICFSAGTPIITNNHWMSITRPQQSFVRSKYVNGAVVPEFEQVLHYTKSIKHKKTNPNMSTQNVIFKSIIDILSEEP